MNSNAIKYIYKQLAAPLMIFVMFSGFLSAIPVQPAEAVIVDRIAAIVNSHVITLSMLEKRAAPYLAEYLKDDMSPEEKVQVRQTVYAKILPQMIDDYLVSQEIERLGITVTDAEVDNAIDSICRNNGITRQVLAEKLRQEGTTFKKYRNQLKTQIERARLINSQVQSKIVITDEQVRSYLQRDSAASEYGGPYYILDHICVVPETDSSSAKSEARKRAEDALKALENGEDFSAVASRYSSHTAVAFDVRLGVFSVDEMSPSIRKAVEDLKPGGYSDVIETPMGYQILRLAGISNSKVEDIDPALMKETRQKLYNEKMNQRFEDWLNELRSKSAIRILL